MIGILSYNSIEDTPYHEWLLEKKEDLYLFVNSEVSEGYIKHNFKNIKIYSNYNHNLNIELDIINIHNTKGPFTQIIALDEFDIDRASVIREKLSIEGQSVLSGLNFRDKLTMKETLYNKSISVTPFSILSNVFDLLDFIKVNNYPVVCKPRRMAGSLGVIFINNPYELREFLKNGIKNDYMIEKYVEGEMYHIDGMIIDHKIEIIFPSKYRSDCVDFDNWESGGFTASYMLDRKNSLYNKLCSFTEEAVSSLPLPKYAPFHAEVFVTDDGKFLFNEVGSRVPGGRSNYEFYYGTGLNFNEITVRLQCGLSINELKVNHKVTGHIYIPPQKGVLKELPSTLPFSFIKEYCPNNKLVGSYFEGAKASVDCIATVICQGEDEREVINNIDRIYRYFIDNVSWKN